MGPRPAFQVADSMVRKLIGNKEDDMDNLIGLGIAAAAAGFGWAMFMFGIAAVWLVSLYSKKIE